MGDTGLYVPPNQPEGLASQIALALTSDKGGEARQRIIEKFHLEGRRKPLLDVMESLIKD